MNEEKVEVKFYYGSLDFPCDICEHNSYQNFHFKLNGNLVGVICEDCLQKIKLEELNKIKGE